MLQRRLLITFALCVSALAHAADRAPITYTLSFPDAAGHYVDVDATIPTDGQAELTLFMPVWTPGSYLVREYAGQLLNLEAATIPGAALTPVLKTTKNRWQVPTHGASEVHIHYRLYARETNVRGNWVESDFAMINGAPTFVTVADDYQRPYEVRVTLPDGWATVQTPLSPTDAPTAFTAPDFDTLVDSPIIAGSPQVDAFEVDGVRHVLVTLGGNGVWDNARMAGNLQRLVEAQRTFWGSLPYDQPYYFMNVLNGSRGGLEHRQAQTIMSDRWASRTRGGVRSWLSLASHEFFHAWNVKRLRPVALGPFDYEHENYTPSLWVAEGLTSYYQHIILQRLGYQTRDQYLGNLSGSIAGIQRTPGRFVQSLEDASFDAWVKGYRPSEDSVNTRVSYYGGGAVVGFLIDAKIRELTDSRASLDDVMRTAFARYSGDRGYTADEFLAVASEVAGQDISAWVNQLVATPGEWDYQPAMDWYGLEFEQPKPPEAPSDQAPDDADPVDPTPGWLGAKTTAKDGQAVITSLPSDTPAAAAGLSVDDEILAVNRQRVDQGNLTRVLAYFPAGTTVNLLVTRQNQVITIPVKLGEEPKATWRLKVSADATDAQKAHLDAWLAPKS